VTAWTPMWLAGLRTSATTWAPTSAPRQDGGWVIGLRRIENKGEERRRSRCGLFCARDTAPSVAMLGVADGGERGRDGSWAQVC
jgi:hypothetical protein